MPERESLPIFPQREGRVEKCTSDEDGGRERSLFIWMLSPFGGFALVLLLKGDEERVVLLVRSRRK
jgi:hypothetical protein